MKKMTSLLLALTLALALAVPAHAAGDESIGIIGGADGPTTIITSGLFGGAATDTAENEEQLAALREQTVTLLGGTAGQINVLLEDRCISFTDAAPALKDGRTMVPMRAALEAMGAVVEYDPATRTALVTGEKASFTHVIGTDLITLSDGTTEKMDVVSYLTETNRTMVPVRFFSQVLGYDVFWDNDYKMVFLLDKESWVESVDGYFTVLNDYLAKSSAKLDAEKSYREEMKLSGTVKLIDSINGDKSYAYSGNMNVLLGKGGMTLSASLDLGELAAMLENLADEQLSAEYRALLSPLTMDAIYGDKLYLKSPLLDAAMEEEGRTGAWYSLSGVDYAALYDTLCSETGYTMGALCYAMMVQGDANHFFESWNGGTTLASMLVELLGDETFTRSGSSYRWHFGLEELVAFLNSIAGIEYYTLSDLREAGVDVLSVDMTLRANGSAEASFAAELSQGGVSVLRMDFAVTGTDTSSTVTGTLQVRNTCDVTLKADIAVRTTDEEIVSAPPAGAMVIPVV